MRHETRSKSELFISNAKAIKKGISWSSASDKRMAALLYAMKGKMISRDAIAYAYDVLKKGTGRFSAFRGLLPVCTAAMLSLEKDPKEALECALSVFDMMREVKFKNSEFLAMAALQITKGTEQSDLRAKVGRMKAFYDGMKEMSWLHTGADDYILAATLAMSDADERKAIGDIEDMYQRLKSEFRGKGSILALAQVLTVGGQVGQPAAERVLALRDALRARKIRLFRSYAMPTLGILAQLPADAETIAQEIKDTEIFLRAQDGMGILSITALEIQMYAAALVAATYVQDAEKEAIAASVSTSMINIMLAIQMAVIVIMVASAAAVAASASG
ncbi:MAG: DUF4003 domain-containing protein [Methanomassiliicoccaceae archaeon]|nr:DUF4003 domain-containing protein [Methanomassiliicoccaceae archaeon]